MSLYRDPRNDYKKPVIEGLVTKNHNAITNHRNIEKYIMLIPNIDTYDRVKEYIYKLVRISHEVFDMRKEKPRKYKDPVKYKSTMYVLCML